MSQSRRSLEKELGLPENAQLLPSTTSPWSLISGGAPIPLTTQSSLGFKKEDESSENHPHCLIVGRQASTADIRIQHGSISRRHALVYHVLEEATQTISLVLQDLGGKHGVYVNENRVKGSILLHKGDKIVFGNVRDNEFTVHHDGEAAARDAAKVETNTSKQQPTQKQQEEPQPAAVQEPGAGLTGREKRQAEIAAMMASLDETPTYTKVELPAESSSKEQELATKESSIARQYKLPVTDRLFLSADDSGPSEDAHRRLVTCLAIDPAGSRCATGGHYLKQYDFAGMDQLRTGPFQTLQVQEGHVIQDVCYSNTGDRLLVATGSAQPKVVSRDGEEVIQFVRGDMYVNDPARTSGHTAPVTGVSWHPLERDVVLTSSLDGSARIWNLNGKTQFKMLVCDKVYRGKNARGQKVAVTSVAFHPGGREFAFGTACGSIQIWNSTKVGARPERATYHAHGEDKPIHSLVYNYDGSRIASRSLDDDTVKVWQARRLSRSATPLAICTQLPSVHERADSTFVHRDGDVLCAGTSTVQKGENGQLKESGTLEFFRISSTPEEEKLSSVLSIPVSSTAGAVQVKWHSKLNQMLVGCSDGSIHVFFDRDLSTKGALLAVAKSGRPVDELSQLYASRAPKGFAGTSADKILTPHALPMFRGEKKRKREKDRLDPVKGRIPEVPATGMKTGSQVGAAVNFQQFVSQGIVKTKNIAGKDPRQELFQYSEGKNYITQAYEGDKTVLAEKTVEEEEQDMKERKT